jgi:hypothetical protein
MQKAVTPEGFDSLRGDEAALRPAPTLRDGAQDESGCSAIHGVAHQNAKRNPSLRSLRKIAQGRQDDGRKKEGKKERKKERKSTDKTVYATGATANWKHRARYAPAGRVSMR